MRLSVLSAMGAAVLLSGCVMVPPPGAVAPANPRAPAVVPPGPVVVTPAPVTRTVDPASARQVVSAEMARRYPGQNVGAMADCIIANATMAEQADLIAMKGTAAANVAMAAIVQRPATKQCIAGAVG
ncbi:MAG TPA: hypothetical protein PLL33_06360 [Paracoccus sp. (in: a-proteobacteria)]|nr:hypothetical protein [Paracoccus sp. (in: a-proteobacteria)]